MKKRTYRVQATLVHARTRQPLPGLRAELLDRDLICDDLVAGAVSDEHGRVSMTFDSTYFRELFFDRRPDLFFRIFDGERLVHDTRDSVLWNVSDPRTELVIEIDLPLHGVSEKPQLGREELLDLLEHAARTPAEVQERNPRLYRLLQGRALSALRQTLDTHFSGASDELREHVRGLDLTPLLQPEQRIRDYLRASVNGAELSELATREGLIRIEEFGAPETLAELLQPDTPLQSNPLFRQELQQGATYQLGEFTRLDAQTLQLLLRRQIHPGNLRDDKLQTLIDEDDLPEDTARELGLNANLYQWTGGDLNLVAAVRERARGPDGGPIRSMRDLAALKRADMIDLLPGKGADREARAAYLAKQVEVLFPNEVFKAQHQPVDASSFTRHLNLLQPLFALQPRLFGGGHSGLNTAGMDKQVAHSALAAYGEASRLAHRHPGLRLGAVLDDPGLPAPEKAAEVARRVDLLGTFYRLNPSVPFLSLDTLPGGDDLGKLDFGGMDDEDRERVLAEIRADQRLYRVTHDAEHTVLIKEKGYRAGHEIAAESEASLIAVTGLDARVAATYHRAARQEMVGTTVATGLVLDQRFGGGPQVEADDNPAVVTTLFASTAARDFLRRLPGYAEFFGGQDYCRCRHCQSIVSPAAYFVDLMDFIKTNILDVAFRAEPTHPLSLRQRRADLWESLRLTCRCTETLVPYLAIINEILENYVYTDGRGGALPATRRPVEDAVYERLYIGKIRIRGPDDPDSFRQPFMLPLERLRIYLSHFPITRAELASVVLEHTGDPDEVIPQARLGLSHREYRLVRTARDDPAFLQRLYGLSRPAEDAVTIPETGDVPAFDAQRLLAPMDIGREELSELIATRFVAGSGAVNLRIQGEPRDGGSVQNDIERIHGLTRGALDRMHRFVRLWKQLSWTIRELDLVLAEVFPDPGGALPLPQVASLLAIQERFGTTVEELCVLVTTLPDTPVADGPSLFDRLFNRQPFARQSVWTTALAENFLHPAFQESPAPASVTTLHRLLAGLSVDDGVLLPLIDHLAEGLSIRAGDTTRRFELTREKLSLLYRHARLASLLKLSVAELFQLLRLADAVPHQRVESLADLEALLAFHDWWKSTRYTLDDLAFITGAPVRNPEPYPASATLVDRLLQDVRESRALVFADTVFAFFEGVTEEQSRAIVRANHEGRFVPAEEGGAPLRLLSIPNAVLGDLGVERPNPAAPEDPRHPFNRLMTELLGWVAAHRRPAVSVFLDTDLAGVGGLSRDHSRAVMAANPEVFQPLAPPVLVPVDLKLYRVSAGADLTTLRFTIPPSVPILDGEALQAELRARLQLYTLPGAPPFTDAVFAGAGGVSAEASSEIFAANPGCFEPVVDAALYWLTPDFNSATPILIPAGIPLFPEAAHAHISRFHAGEVIPTLLAGLLALSVDRLGLLARLAGYDPSDAGLGRVLTRILQGDAPPDPLHALVERVHRLKVLFQDRAFTPKALRFIREHAGARDRLFPILDFRSPTMGDVRALSRYRRFLGGEDADLAPLHDALRGFRSDTRRFDDAVLDDLARVLETERGLVATLNRTIGLPGPATPDPENRTLQALVKLRRCVELAQMLGAGGDVLALITSSDYDALARAADALFTAFRTRYAAEEEWEKKIEPFENRIRERKRDALSNYIIHTLAPEQFRNTNDLYHWFLIDTELEGCARTSKVVAGISSLQLYVHRCLMKLEQSGDGSLRVDIAPEAAAEWEWRKNYRVWEANRKVFLWPENYVEPELRDDKTPLFEELEADLLQRPIDAQSVLDAYATYLRGFEEIARLRIAGAYHDRSESSGASDVLHLFGATSTDPPVYYYRTVENVYRSLLAGGRRGIVWNPWRKVEVQIPVRQVSPILANGRLHVFWVQITTRPVNETVAGSSRFVGYEHKLAVKFTTLRLDDGWTAPQQIPLGEWGTVNDPLAEPGEIQSFSQSLIAPEMVRRGTGELLNEVTSAVVARAAELLQQDPDLIRRSSYSLSVVVEQGSAKHGFTFDVDFTNPMTRNLFKPGHDLDPHVQPKDHYTLTGYPWNRVYPSEERNRIILPAPGFAGIPTIALLDLYRLKLGHPVSVVGFDPLRIRRLFQVPPSAVHGGFLDESSVFVPYRDAEDVSHGRGRRPMSAVPIISAARSSLELMIVNGSLSDGIVDVDSDHFYLYSPPGEVAYVLRRLGTTLSEEMGRTLFEGGVEALLDVRNQEALRESVPPFTFMEGDTSKNQAYNVALGAVEKGTPDFTGPLGVYFREVFFHVPFLIANHLNSQGKFADADRWYRHIFDPASDKLPPDLSGLSGEVRRRREKDRVWQYVEFRNHTLQTLREQLRDEEAVEAYRRDPFNPHAIARLRLGAYKKAVVMKYIDNCLDWGDHLFAQDTMESVNEATMLYVMAADLLGPRPPELGDCEQAGRGDWNYQAIVDRMNRCELSDFASTLGDLSGRASGPAARSENGGSGKRMSDPNDLREASASANAYFAGVDWRISGAVHHEGDGAAAGAAGLRVGGIPLEAHFKGLDWKRKTAPYGIALFGTGLLRAACVFCIPPNRELLGYWDRVEDRLYKIRNCMNISGVRRQLPLFAPEIDPRLLVRAKAAGLSLEDVLDTTSGNLPPYRFGFLIVKAREYAAALQGFGSALLAALEKKDAEELARMKLVYQQNTLKLTTRLRDQEIEAAEATLESLVRRRQTVTNRRDFFGTLIDQGLSEWEEMQVALKVHGHLMKILAAVISVVAAGAAIPPGILGFSNSTPPDSLKHSAKAWANVFSFLSEASMISSDLAGVQAGFERRQQGWEQQLDLHNDELKEIEQLIVVQEIRRDMALHSRTIHERSMAELDEVLEFYQEKFSSFAMFTWLSTHLQRLYREAYQSAYAMARLAERAYRFERGNDTAPLLQGGYWDATRAGLLAGEALMADLRSLEQRYMESHYRSLEIDQAFSLMQINPQALIQLKETGSCEFSIHEFFFDLFYPGHYRRRIKSARLTIPSITGPYTNVGATLTLTGSEIRNEPRPERQYLVPVPPTRTVTIATSTAQNDSGVFRLDFRDERYMPFEGAGAVSSWRLSLPKNFRPFDYATINDVILHISYEADTDELLRERVERTNGELEKLLCGEVTGEAFTMKRVFSLRQEFSTAFHQLLHSPANTPISIELSDRHFPLFLQGRQLAVVGSALALSTNVAPLREVNGRLPEDFKLPEFSIAHGANTEGLDSFGDSLGGLAAAKVEVFTNAINPGTSSVKLSLSVTAPYSLAPKTRVASDPSALDDSLLKDVYLYLEYRIAAARNQSTGGAPQTGGTSL